MKKIVGIKVGSGILLTSRNKLDEFRIAHIADQVASLQKARVGVVLVISGAVACGSNYIGLEQTDKKLRQAAAGVGQAYLISTIQRLFGAKKITIAQVLLTQSSFASSEDTEAIRRVLNLYIHKKIVPIINENDVVSLNSFGGNDLLAAKIVSVINAEQLVILSTMSGSIHGVGGGETKQETLSLLDEEGVRARIVDGKTKNIILETVL